MDLDRTVAGRCTEHAREREWHDRLVASVLDGDGTGRERSGDAEHGIGEDRAAISVASGRPGWWPRTFGGKRRTAGEREHERDPHAPTTRRCEARLQRYCGTTSSPCIVGCIVQT